MDTEFIGIIDSGFGGLSVLNELITIMPNKNYIFYADSINSPFGNKNIDILLKITKNIINNLIKVDVSEIVIACGTISTNLLDILKKEYPNINFIGTFPDFEQLITKNLELNNNTLSLINRKLNIKRNRKKMLILATNATCKSKYLIDKVNNYNKFIDIYIEPAQELVTFVENDMINSTELNDYLKNLLCSYYDTNYIVLGCTHFPFLVSKIKEHINKDVIFLDGCKIAAKKAAKVAANNMIVDNTNDNFIKIIDTNINEYRKKIYFKLIKKTNQIITFI